MKGLPKMGSRPVSLLAGAVAIYLCGYGGLRRQFTVEDRPGVYSLPAEGHVEDWVIRIYEVMFLAEGKLTGNQFIRADSTD